VFTSKGAIAAGLQKSVTRFLESQRWQVAPLGESNLVAKRDQAGFELRWGFHFEDEQSLSQARAARDYVDKLLSEARDYQFFDLVVTERVVGTARWKHDIAPLLQQHFLSKHRLYGTLTEFLNRFTKQIADAYDQQIGALLREHFIRTPVRPSFMTSPDALNHTVDWVTTGLDARLMLVMGDAGAGKSVFALMLVQELNKHFSTNPNVYPVPFLIRYSRERPSRISDLITLTLRDLHLEQLVTVDAIRFLLEEGRILYVLDGFDEISRAAAQNAEENLEELGANVNRRRGTRGKLILTSRASFIAQEDTFAGLKSACGLEEHEEYILAPYTDGQMQEWVLNNPPPESPREFTPAQHWERIRTAFRQHPGLKELCRTPVYLRMLSDVLAQQRSVSSLHELLEAFAKTMWERERPKRTLELTDDQYFYAYEAIARAVAEEKRLSPKDVRAALSLYLEEYAPELVGSLPADAEKVVADLAIGPLTYRNGIFTFVHEVLYGYFFAKLLARSLARRKRISELWNRRFEDVVWRFLGSAVEAMLPDANSRNAILDGIVRRSRYALESWNIVRALRIPVNKLPRDLLRGKEIANVVLEQVDLGKMSFQDCQIHDLTLDRCHLDGTDFRGSQITKLKFIQCEGRPVFDARPRVSESSEVAVRRAPEADFELYRGEEIVDVLREIGGMVPRISPVPQDLAEVAIVKIFETLFRVDRRTLDYPERAKIENRLRGWVRGFGLSDVQQRALTRILVDLAEELEGTWVSRNPNRPRTLVPAKERAADVHRIVAQGRITGHADLRKIASRYQTRIDATLR
jgi:hypothetical protein